MSSFDSSDQSVAGGREYVAPRHDAKSPHGQGFGCLAGCLVAAAFCMMLCAGGGVYFALHAKQFATGVARRVVQTTVDQAELPEEEKSAILDQVDRVATAYENGEITHEQLAHIMEEIMESKVWGLVLVKALERKYLDPSGLSPEEKAEGKQIIARVLQGAMDGLIEDQEIKELSRYFMEPSADGSKDVETLKDHVSDSELRELLAEAKALVDRKEVPTEPRDVHFSEELQTIVDRALAE